MVFTLRYLYLIFFGGMRQSALTVETYLKVTAAWGWGDEVLTLEGFWVVNMTVHCVDEPLFLSDLLLTFMYAMTILISSLHT